MDVTVVVAWGRVVGVGPDGAVRWVRVIGGQGPPDLAAVDELARCLLAARRAGGSIALREQCEALARLLDLVGLLDLLGREMGGQAEGGEQVGVEEGVEPRDPVA
jgi:hypothetical protein